MGRKIAATIVAILVLMFPFRWAYLSDNDPGITMMLSFLLTLAGIVAFYILTLKPSKRHG